MMWESRPLPDVTPETEPFWVAAAGGEFLLQECTDCGLTYYYPRALCPDCLGDDVESVTAAGTGEVYTYSVMEELSRWPDEALPLVAAYVELDEGPRIMSNLVDIDAAAVEIGMPVEVAFEPTRADDLAIPVFAPR